MIFRHLWGKVKKLDRKHKGETYWCTITKLKRLDKMLGLFDLKFLLHKLQCRNVKNLHIYFKIIVQIILKCLPNTVQESIILSR